MCSVFENTAIPVTYFRFAHHLRKKVPDVQSRVGERVEWSEEEKQETDRSAAEGKRVFLSTC